MYKLRRNCTAVYIGDSCIIETFYIIITLFFPIKYVGLLMCQGLLLSEISIFHWCKLQFNFCVIFQCIHQGCIASSSHPFGSHLFLSFPFPPFPFTTIYSTNIIVILICNKIVIKLFAIFLKKTFLCSYAKNRVNKYRGVKYKSTRAFQFAES